MEPQMNADKRGLKQDQKNPCFLFVNQQLKIE